MQTDEPAKAISRANVTLTAIETAGMAMESVGGARREIEFAFELFRGLITRMCPGATIRVSAVISDDYQEAVRHVEAEYQLTRSRPYEARREFSAAIATVRWRLETTVTDATIIVNAEPWKSNEPIAVLYRFSVLIHEFCHLLFEAMRQAEGTIDALPPAGLRTIDRAFLALGYQVWEEYRVDGLVDTALQLSNLFTDDNGRPVVAVETYGAGYDNSLKECLDWFCPWVCERVQRYRMTSTGLEEIWNEAAPRVEEMFTLLAHALGTYASAGRIEDLYHRLEEGHGFRTFLMEDWGALVSVFELPRDDAATQLRDISFRVMERLGFRPEQVSSGLYIRVFQPRFCDE